MLLVFITNSQHNLQPIQAGNSTIKTFTCLRRQRIKKILNLTKRHLQWNRDAESESLIVARSAKLHEY